MEENAYNATKKVNASDKFFMMRSNVYNCILSLKCKNLEVFDLIPQRILLDEADILINPLTVLFKKVFIIKNIPSQWLVAKTKGDKKDIESYRPIANLCATSKSFEKLILKHILNIQNENKCDLIGVNQHKFKQKRSTSTLSLQIQSLLTKKSLCWFLALI
jgi:hypothetical protein